MFIYFIPNYIATQNTYHIFIGGIVQGVGFRPFVLQLARQWGLNGWVNNDSDGVHIEINAPGATATQFYAALEENAPVHALITHRSIHRVADTVFTDFRIMPSRKAGEFSSVLISPDFSLCRQCREELHDATNRRHRYAFTTLPFAVPGIPLCGHCHTIGSVPACSHSGYVPGVKGNMQIRATGGFIHRQIHVPPVASV